MDRAAPLCRLGTWRSVAGMHVVLVFPGEHSSHLGPLAAFLWGHSWHVTESYNMTQSPVSS